MTVELHDHEQHIAAFIEFITESDPSALSDGFWFADPHSIYVRLNGGNVWHFTGNFTPAADGGGSIGAGSLGPSHIFVNDGDASVPGYSFSSDQDNGIYRPGTNRVGISTAGTARWEVSASGMLIPAADNTYDIGSSAASAKDVWLDGLIQGAQHIETPTSFGATTNWTAGTTNPTNRVWTAFYVQTGKVVDVWVQAVCGAGFTVGSGQYIFLLQGTIDATAAPANMAIGEWVQTISGANTSGEVRRQGTNQCRMSITGGGTLASTPAMAAGDSIMFHARYPVT